MEINYKAKIQLQIVMEKLKLNPEQVQILEEELIPLYKELYVEDAEEIDAREKELEAAYESGYDEGYEEAIEEHEDDYDNGYKEGYEECKKDFNIEDIK